MHGAFIWTDLSTYHLNESLAFYSSIFNWKFIDDAGYHIGSSDADFVVGMYETPAFFQKINMPHFWMNYIQVDDVDSIVNRAKSLNGKIELENEDFANGKIALIRDPMGAGFTVYEGSQLGQSSDVFHGAVLYRDLHTSNAKLQLEFYQKLFGWNTELSASGGFIFSNNDKMIANVVELSNEDKGQYEYWVTVFNVFTALL